MLMKKKIAAFLAGAMLLTACGGSNDSVSPTEHFKDFFIIGSDFETLNYLNSSAAVNTRVFNQFMSGLTDTDEYGNIVGDMAESWEPNEDYTVWTFHLRDGINWFKRDGSVYAPVKAQDWVTALQWELTKENGSTCTEMATNHLVNAEEYLTGAETDFSKVGVSAPDDKTVVFTLKNPAPWFDTVTLYSSFYPMNADFYAEINKDQDTEKFGSTIDNVLSNGAYILKEHTADSEKRFEANPGYWDADNVKVKVATSIAVKDTESTKALFESGDLSYCVLSGTQPDAEARKGNEYMYKSDPIACSYVFFFNNWCTDENARKAINNENFRKAIQYGWDRKDYVSQVDPLEPESIYSYLYSTPDFITTSDGTDYTDLPAVKEWNKNVYDHDKGVEYMNKAVEELKAEGVTFPVVLPYYIKAGNETAANTAQLLKNSFEEAFPDLLTIDIQEYAQTFSADVAKQLKHGIAGAGWVPDYKDPSNVLGSIVPGPGGYMNNTSDDNAGYSHWDYPEFVELFDKACAEVGDIDLRYNLFAEAEAYLFEHAYYIPLYLANTQYRMTKYNPYSRTFSKTGGTEYRYKRIELFEDTLTAEQVAQYKEDWQKAKLESVKKA